MLNTDVPPGWRDVTALLLAVEIVSPSSARSDRVEKRDHYLDAGVPDYWVVDLDARMVECWTPLRATPVVESARLVWLPEGTVRPFVVDLSALFQRIWRKSREGR
jgi:Uma2 family endonuclease